MTLLNIPFYTCAVGAAVKLITFVARADETAVGIVTDVVTRGVPLTLVDVLRHYNTAQH